MFGCNNYRTVTLLAIVVLVVFGLLQYERHVILSITDTIMKAEFMPGQTNHTAWMKGKESPVLLIYDSSPQDNGQRHSDYWKPDITKEASSLNNRGDAETVQVLNTNLLHDKNQTHSEQWTAGTTKEHTRPNHIGRAETLLNMNNRNQDNSSTGDRGTTVSPVLLLSSVGRSGSTFLGELLASPPWVFYFFEPLYMFRKNGLTEPFVVSTLESIFTCNITRNIRTAVLAWPSVLKTMISKGNKNLKSELDKQCRETPVKVVKTIRTRVSWVDSLLNLLPKLKVVHLLRDPRGSIPSALARKWNIQSPKNICNIIEDDLYHGSVLAKRHPERYVAVRYEDLCGDPWGMALRLFTFIGYPHLHNDTVKYLMSHTTGKETGNPYGSTRDTQRMKERWRSVISQQQLTDIESGCSSIITQLGFNLFGSLEAARNLSLPLSRGPPDYEFF